MNPAVPRLYHPLGPHHYHHRFLQARSLLTLQVNLVGNQVINLVGNQVKFLLLCLQHQVANHLRTHPIVHQRTQVANQLGYQVLCQEQNLVPYLALILLLDQLVIPPVHLPITQVRNQLSDPMGNQVLVLVVNQVLLPVHSRLDSQVGSPVGNHRINHLVFHRDIQQGIRLDNRVESQVMIQVASPHPNRALYLVVVLLVALLGYLADNPVVNQVLYLAVSRRANLRVNQVERLRAFRLICQLDYQVITLLEFRLENQVGSQRDVQVTNLQTVRASSLARSLAEVLRLPLLGSQRWNHL